jgi:hypothetical protein
MVMKTHMKLYTVGSQQGRKRTHEGGLAGAVRPQQRGDLPGLSNKVKALERRDVAEVLGELSRLDDGGHGVLLSTRRQGVPLTDLPNEGGYQSNKIDGTSVPAVVASPAHHSSQAGEAD